MPCANNRYKGGVGRNEDVEVSDRPILLEERARVPARVERHANHLASIVNAEASAVNVPLKRAEVCMPVSR